MNRSYLALVVLCGCSWSVVDPPRQNSTASTQYSTPPDTGGGGGSATSTCEETIDAKKELLVVNQTVLLDPRAAADSGSWSFGARLAALAGDRAAAGAMFQGWLGTWSAPRDPKPLADSWYARGTLPFKLIGIVNRLDLGTRCGASQGELRFVYAAVDAKNASLPFTVIVEVPYPGGTDFTARWHALGKLPFGDAYNEALESITNEATKNTSGVRIRTDESALSPDSSWELRQFAVQGGALVPVLLDQTPRFDLAKSESLDAWADDNAASILDGTFALPTGFRAETAPLPFSWFRWESTRMRPDVRQALSLATCSGCHGGERGADTMRFQHLAPPDLAYYGSMGGETQVSSFLERELVTRASKLSASLCTRYCCGPASRGNSWGRFARVRRWSSMASPRRAVRPAGEDHHRAASVSGR